MNLRSNPSFRSAAALLLALAALSGCSDDDDNGTGPAGEGPQLQLNGFPASTPAEGTFELWISFAEGARHANAESMGKFRVNAQGNAVGLSGETDPFADQDHTWQL